MYAVNVTIKVQNELAKKAIILALKIGVMIYFKIMD